MTLALAAASHSPLMKNGEASPETRAAVASAFASLGREIEAFEPELAIQFSPDHLNAFFYDLMPAFCVGAAADSIGDWGTRAGPVDVPEALSVGLAEHLLESGIDTALSYRMKIDHGFVQFWENSLGAITVPLIPVFINCAAPPLPTMRRARLLGEAVGYYAASLGRRVLIVASGGLSHDPPTPQMAGAPPELRERLIANRHPSEEARKLREQRILAAGHMAASGRGSILPVSIDWDHDFLDRLRNGDAEAFDDIAMPDIVALAGRGGPETLCWVAAMAALRTAGPVETKLHFYEAIQGWIAGMALLSARPA
jgi:2,3-dihydroxyphenylpropionate 1,2-dioxygenase